MIKVTDDTYENFIKKGNKIKILNELTKSFNIPKTCIEFGAHDGITNSNTFYFWKKK